MKNKKLVFVLLSFISLIVIGIALLVIKPWESKEGQEVMGTNVVTATPTPTIVATITEAPTTTPTVVPTEVPTEIPTEAPTVVPTEIPTVEPTVEPTEIPTVEVTPTPTVEATPVPTKEVTPTPKPTKEPTPTVKPTATPTPKPTKEPEPTKVPEKEIEKTGYSGKTINIEGTEVPILDKFATNNLYNSKNWGGEQDGSRETYNALMDVETTLKELYESDSDIVFAFGDEILISDNGDIDNPLFTLKKNSDKGYYELTLKVRLKLIEDSWGYLNKEEYAVANRTAVKALCATISSTPDTLYDAIYEAWELGSSYGINKETWVDVGDAKVKYQKGGTYLIKEK